MRLLPAGLPACPTQPTTPPPCCPPRYGSTAWQLLPELHREPGDYVITSKRTYDAFQVSCERQPGWHCSCQWQCTAWYHMSLPCSCCACCAHITALCVLPPMRQGTELQELLQRHGCDTVIVGGVMTNLCCETTARWAAVLWTSRACLFRRSVSRSAGLLHVRLRQRPCRAQHGVCATQE